MSYRRAFDHYESCSACQSGECAEGTRLWQRAHEALMKKADPTPPETENEA